MVKLIFFDIDGTLLSHSAKEVPPSARAAIKKLQQKGIKCVAATGRHILELEALPVRDIEFDAYITLVGQICLDRDKKLIVGFPFPAEDRQRLVEIFREKRYPMQLVQEDRMYANFINDRMGRVQQDISTPLPLCGDYEGGEIYQVMAYMDRDEEAALAPQLQSCLLTRWHNEGLDILPGGGGKILGISAYLKAIGVDPSETMAFGDGENDAEMLSFVGTGVAMGNAEEITKKSADYVTDHIDRDGVEKALIHFGLI